MSDSTRAVTVTRALSGCISLQNVKISFSIERQPELFLKPVKCLITLTGLARLAGLVSVCRDLGTFVKCNKNQLRDYMTTGPARLAEIPANRARIFPCNRVYRASPAH